jgi:hypothetical protein
LTSWGQVTIEFVIVMALASMIFLFSLNLVSQERKASAQGVWSGEAVDTARRLAEGINSVCVAGSGSSENLTLPAKLAGGTRYNVTIRRRLVTVEVPAYGREFEWMFICGDVSGSTPPFPVFTGVTVSLTNINGTVKFVSHTTTTTSTSTSTTTTTFPTNCNALCGWLGPYSPGTCRQNVAQCGNNGEVHEPQGDALCVGGPSADTCCCLSGSTTTTTSATSTTTLPWAIVRPQACAAAVQEAAAGSFPDPCGGTYPGACPAALVSCDDGQYEDMKADKDEYCGVMLRYYNATVGDCTAIRSVSVCFEWWATTNSPDGCDVSVSRDGEAWAQASGACHTTANPGITCANVTSATAWGCSDFFGASASGAYIRQNARNSQNNKDCRVDVLLYNVTYV